MADRNVEWRKESRSRALESKRGEVEGGFPDSFEIGSQLWSHTHHTWRVFETLIKSKSAFSTIGRRRASRKKQFWSRTDCARPSDGRVGEGKAFSFEVFMARAEWQVMGMVSILESHQNVVQ